MSDVSPSPPSTSSSPTLRLSISSSRGSEGCILQVLGPHTGQQCLEAGSTTKSCTSSAPAYSQPNQVRLSFYTSSSSHHLPLHTASSSRSYTLSHMTCKDNAKAPMPRLQALQAPRCLQAQLERLAFYPCRCSTEGGMTSQRFLAIVASAQSTTSTSLEHSGKPETELTEHGAEYGVPYTFICALQGEQRV